MKPPCQHYQNHRATVSVNYLEDTGRFCADVRIECADCGRPFQFLGLPLGVDLTGATMDVDGQEARLAIAPVGCVPQPLDRALAGFRVRIPGDPDLVRMVRNFTSLGLDEGAIATRTGATVDEIRRALAEGLLQ